MKGITEQMAEAGWRWCNNAVRWTMPQGLTPTQRYRADKRARQTARAAGLTVRTDYSTRDWDLFAE